jgi:glycosyltransferase involved in cell wall biosynthesis
MKVGLFSESYKPCVDGVSRFLQDFTSELSRAGIESTIYTSIPGKKEPNVRRIRSLPFPLYNNYWLSYFWVNDYVKRAKEDKPDIVHINTPFIAGLGGVIAARELGVPIVGTFHTNVRDMAPAVGSSPAALAVADMFNKLTIYIYDECEVVTAPTKSMRDFLLDQGLKTRVEVVPPGVRLSQLVGEAGRYDFRTELGIPKDAKVILYLGRITLDKGVHYLLDAFGEIMDLQNTYLVYGGTGPELKALRGRAADERFGNRVKILGYVKERHKASLISQADVMVLPSIGDTFGLSLAEGMALGKVVIASNMGGLKDWVTDGFNGIVFDYGKKNLADKLRYALTEDLTDMGQRASKWALENVSIERVTHRFIQIFEGLVQKPIADPHGG